MLKLYNTETRKKELISPTDGGLIKIYTCGPTIYDFAHIGNFRTYVVEDLLRRALQFFGHRIEQVMNLTDVDDKTIRGALKKKLSLKEYTEPFRIAFFEDLQILNIQKAEHYPAATDYISEMIAMIEELLKKGYAYVSPNKSVYFSIRQFSSYGRLSHFDLSELKVNASGDNEADEYDKENISDFVLWKAYDPIRDGEIFWDSPFGLGRPGWHIECSAMATKILGSSIDIHCGGVDNLFPHHENEIAQSESCTDCRFVRHWLHVEHLLVDHKKMSKSLGNFYTLRDLLSRGYTGKEVRYLLLATHYRTQLNFTLPRLDAARSSLIRIKDFVTRLKEVREKKIQIGFLEKYRLQFQSALADDLNIAMALAALFDMIREANTLCDEEKLGFEEARLALDLLKNWDQVLGVIPFEEEEVSHDLVHLLEMREKARKEKNWALSDQMRDEVLKKGYLIEDTPQGARLKKK